MKGWSAVVFSSFGFLFLFFPIFLILYRTLPRRFSTALLCAGSLAFYAIGVRSEPWQLFLLVGMTALGLLGCALFSREGLRKKGLLALWIAVITAPLIYVKLAGLILEDAPALPLGLSFYTFELIALLCHAFRGGKISAMGGAACVLMFPKLISGPLAEPAEIREALERPRPTYALLDEGLERFILGLAFKLVIADHLGGVLGQIRTWGVEAVSVPMAWLGVACYALQLYFDFAGYSSMAVGLGLMLGIRLPENFDHPYCAASIAEFWRRWHITLGAWFRNYVYIPLGGSRRGTARMALATLAVWLLTGIWHGAGWNYVAWGMMMFLLIMGERLLYGDWLKRHALLGHICVPLLIGLSWILFITPTLGDAGRYLLRLVGGGGLVGASEDWLDALSWCWPYLAMGVLLSTPLPAKLWRRISGTFFAWVLLFMLFWVSVYFLATASSDPFLYFSF